MSRHHRTRYDDNHHITVGHFLALGCSVTDTAGLGAPGFPDLVVGCCGVNHLVEVKNLETAYGRRGLAPQQTAYNDGWRGEAVELVTCLGDVEDLVRKWRRAPSLYRKEPKP